MRSFREIVFRAALDGREASLVRAMGIEVVRYLARAGLRSASRRWRIRRDHGPLERLLGGQSLPGPDGRAGADRAAPAISPRPRPPASRRCAPGCWRSTASRRGALHGRDAGAGAWEYGIGNRKLCWLHVIGDGSRPPSP